MSSSDSQQAVLEAFEAGAQDYLIKPIRRQVSKPS
jgi:PleD family two-component response regulator